MTTTKTASPESSRPIQDLRIPERWRLERPLGRGGQGEVWLATDQKLKQKVAIKILPADIDASQMARIRREVGIGRKLEHPHILRIHELVESTNTLAIIMQWMPGGSLAHAAATGPLPIERVIEIAEQILEGLAHLHGQRILHRDVKPSNILVDQDGSVRLGDLGLIRPLESNEEVTRTNVAVGTVAFMSPEQIRAEAPSPAADLYSLGATLYNLITGKKPFPADSDLLVFEAHLNRKVENPRKLRPECPRWFARFIVRLMEKKAADRWPDAAAALAAFRTRRGLFSPRIIRKTALWIAAGVLVGLLGWILADSRTQPLLDARTIGNDVVVFDERGDEMWRKSYENEPVETLVADVVGDAKAEIIVGLERLDDNETLLSSIEVLTGAGSTIANFGVAFPGCEWTGRDIKPGAELSRFLNLDIEGHTKHGLQWIAIHPTWSPSVLCSWGPRSNPHQQILLSNSGHLRDAAAADLNGDGRPELITWGKNNALGYQTVVAVIDTEPGTPSPSPDQLRQWRDFRDQGPANQSVLAYTPLGRMNADLHFESTAEGFKLSSKTRTFEFDRDGMPAGLSLPISSKFFWDDLGETLLQLGTGGDNLQQLLVAFRLRHAKILSNDPFSLATLFLTARSLALIGEAGMAAEVFENARARHGDSPDFLIRQGELLALAGDTDQARKVLYEALANPYIRGPSTLEAFTHLLFLDCLSGDNEAFQNSIDLVWSAHAGRLTEEMKNAALAARAFFRGAWIDPSLDSGGNLKTMKWVAVLRAWADLERSGDLAPTERFLAAFKGNSELTILGRLYESRVLLEQGRVQRALSVADEAYNDLRQSSRESLDALAWRSLAAGMVGRCLKELGREDEA
ncbi:MAG: hypothetical protein DRQ40_07635, partial [Gammaproteobacteria bacterium]